MNKKIEIVIKGEYAYDPEILKEISKGNFSIEISYHPPTPIRTRMKAFGAEKEGRETVVGLRPSIEPPVIYLTVGEGRESRLRMTAQQLLDYYDQHGIQKFRQHFGDEKFVEFLRDFLREGGSPIQEN